MSNSVVNQQFCAISTGHYAQAGLVARAKGQRCGKDDLPLMLFGSELPAGYRVVVLGTGPGYGEHGQVIQYEHLAVHANGYVYPAYRRAGGDFCICRNSQYVGRRG